MIKAPQRVVWSEGMLMSPQHLQQQDLYFERLLDARLAVSSPYAWGVADLDLDLAALSADQLRITRFAGVLPDGLVVAFDAGASAEAPPARPIGSHFSPSLPALEIFLGVPKEREGVPSVADGVGGGVSERTRYRSASRAVRDLTGEGTELAVAFAQRNVVVLFGSESRDDYDALKIAEIVRDRTGALTVNEAYIPPVLRMGASPFLMSASGRLLATLVAKQRQLSAERREREGGTVEFVGNDITRFLQLDAINGVIPLLTHASQAGEFSPRELYLALSTLAGRLCTFSLQVDPAKLPAFSYGDLRGTFEELFAVITALLRSTVRELYVPVPLQVHGSIHVGKLDDERLARCHQFVLAVRGDRELTPEIVAQRLPGLCKLASPAQLETIMRAATPGVPLQSLQRPPPEIPARPGVVYFALTLGSEYWRLVLQERAASIYLPPPFDPSRVQLELFGIPRPG